MLSLSKGVGIVLSAIAGLFLLVACNSGSPLDGLADYPSTAGTSGELQIVNSLPPPVQTNSGSELRISQDDMLEVNVFQVQGLDRTVRVESNGSISLPLVGEVKAAGLTLRQLETSLEKTYGQKYLQSPEISVFMKESAGQRITIDGEFGKSGMMKVDSQSTLLKVAAQAGGLSKIADADKVFIYRTYPNGKKVAQYSITKIRKGTLRDPRVFGGDVIVAFPSSAKVAAQNLKEALGLASTVSRAAALPL